MRVEGRRGGGGGGRECLFPRPTVGGGIEREGGSKGLWGEHKGSFPFVCPSGSLFSLACDILSFLLLQGV